MTRINCIPVSELTDKHLLAEYRELPRVFKLARLARGNEEATWPKEYTLGRGHVLFFYDKLKYCLGRQIQLYDEMMNRGFKPTFNPSGLLTEWPHKFSKYSLLFNDWVPTVEAMTINRQRIKERLDAKTSK